MVTNGDTVAPQNAKNFYCEKCDFVCSKQSEWSRHSLTSKHRNGDKMVTNGDKW